MPEKALPENSRAEAICPRCGQSNSCYMVKVNSDLDPSEISGHSDKFTRGKGSASLVQEPCWCMDVSLSDKQRQELSQYKATNSCLCQNCIIAFSLK